MKREGVRVEKPPRVKSGRYLSTWKDVSTLPAHPKEGEHAASLESRSGRAMLAMAKRCYVASLIRPARRGQGRPCPEGNDSRCRAPFPERQARRDCPQYNGAGGP